MSPRRIIVSRAEAGQSVAAVLKKRLGLSWSQARQLVQDERVRLSSGTCRNPSQRLKAGQRLDILLPAKPDRSRAAPTARRSKSSPFAVPLRRSSELPQGVKPSIIRYADEHVVVVDKPAGLTTMRHRHEAEEFGARARKFLPPTLADVLPALLARREGKSARPLRAVHRIDRDTSGLVVFARTPAAERHLSQQFRAHTVERHYLALVRGQARSERIESFLIRDRGDGRRGSVADSHQGQRAISHVRIVEELGDFTLIECRLETGRTHQARIHLGEKGTPLCGERVYDRPVHGQPLPDTSDATRPLLHAAFLAITHPVSGQRLSWTSPLPADMAALLRRLRRQVARQSKNANHH
ncbi:MAG: RluA family pseudouridine synthase [Gemmataceae bacterium]